MKILSNQKIIKKIFLFWTVAKWKNINFAINLISKKENLHDVQKLLVDTEKIKYMKIIVKIYIIIVMIY